MKNFISALFLFFCVLFLGLFFNFIVGLLFSNKVAYNAFSQTTEGVKFIDENNVKFLSDRVVSTFWTDFYINKKGHFIYDYWCWVFFIAFW